MTSGYPDQPSARDWIVTRVERQALRREGPKGAVSSRGDFPCICAGFSTRDEGGSSRGDFPCIYVGFSTLDQPPPSAGGEVVRQRERDEFVDAVLVEGSRGRLVRCTRGRDPHRAWSPQGTRSRDDP